MTSRGEGFLWHTLALKLGGTVAELQRRMSCREFVAWREYHKVRPFGDDVEDLRFGQIASMFYNAWRATGGPRAPNDFTFGREPAPPRQTGAEIGRRLVAWFGARRREGK